jgi:hypothetical protein
MRTPAEQLMNSAELEPLLDRLATYVGDEAEKAHFLVDREALGDIVLMAALAYEGMRFSADKASNSILHELKAPIDRIRQLLICDDNYGEVLVALGAPVMLAMGPDREAVDRATERHDTLLNTLDDIARALPPLPPKREAGRPSKTHDLRYMVGTLAERWEAWTRLRFKQYWRNGKPGNNATKFVFDIVEFIAPERLKELPEVTEKIVHLRRAGRRDSRRPDIVATSEK